MKGKKEDWLRVGELIKKAAEDGTSILDVALPDGRRFGELRRTELRELAALHLELANETHRQPLN